MQDSELKGSRLRNRSLAVARGRGPGVSVIPRHSQYNRLPEAAVYLGTILTIRPTLPSPPSSRPGCIHARRRRRPKSSLRRNQTLSWPVAVAGMFRSGWQIPTVHGQYGAVWVRTELVDRLSSLTNTLAKAIQGRPCVYEPNEAITLIHLDGNQNAAEGRLYIEGAIIRSSFTLTNPPSTNPSSAHRRGAS